LPLSAAQTDVWRAQKLAPENAKYNVAAYQEIFGAIDRKLFEAALRQAIGESDTHNSRFVETKDGPRQISGSRTEFKIPFMDLSREADARATAIAWMQAAMYEPFDLENGPLFRFALIRIADDRIFWFMIFHHIVTDLVDAGYIKKTKEGRRNRYEVQAHMPLPEPTSRERAIGDVLKLLGNSRRKSSPRRSPLVERRRT